MVLYKGYCRPLGKKVDFTVEDVISMNTTRGIKWRVKGKFEDYNISTFCSNEKAQELLSKLPLKMDAEIAYIPPPTTYDAEELMPSFSNISKDSESSIITYEAEELIPYIVKTPKAEEAFPLHEQIQENTNAQELELQSEKLPAKYYKKDGSLDMRYTVCREFAAKKAESQNAVELEAPYTPIEPERPSDDYDGGGRHRKKPRRPLGAERGRKAWLEKCDICSEGPIYEKDVNIEDYDDPIQVCQSCFDDIFTDKAAESFEAEDNYKLGNYADYEILELDTHSYLMSVGHSESEAEDLIERYEAFIEVGFENGDSPYEIGISITENERLDNDAESFEAELSHEDKATRIYEGIQQNINNPETVRFYYELFYGEPPAEDYEGDMALDVIEAVQQNLNGKEFVDYMYGEMYGAESFEAECKHENWERGETIEPHYIYENGELVDEVNLYWVECNECGAIGDEFVEGEGPTRIKWDAESFEAELSHEDKATRIYEGIQQNINNPETVRFYYELFYGEPPAEDYEGDMALDVIEAVQQNLNGKEFVDYMYGEMYNAESFEAAYTPEQRLDDYTPEQLTTSSSVTGDFFEDSLKYSYGGFQAENEELGETSYAEDVPDLQRAEAGMEVENIEQAYKKKEDQFMTLVVDDATLFRLAPHLPDFVEIEDSQLAGYTTLKFNFVENPEMEQQILSYAIDVVADTDEEAEEPEFKEGDVRNRLFNVEFDDWAEQEMLTHGKDVSFKEWADEESESHGDDEFMDWANHEEESHDERYEAEGAKRRSFKVWGMKEGRKYWQGQFDLQMQDWLEFAWINGDNPQFKTYQGERLTQDGNGNYIGSPKGVKKSNIPTGTKMRNVINTNELYKAWKNQSPVIEATAQKRCLVSYQEAVPEMHIFLDYMEDAGIDIKEAEWRNLSDFEMGDRDRYALGDEIIAISQTLRENKVDDWRAVKKLGKAIKQGKFTRVRDEMGNIGVYSRRGVWDKHHKDFFELFSDSQIQALDIPWVVNDYRAEITDEDLSELESKLDRKIDSFVKGLNYTQCVACDKEAKVEILEDNDGNPIYQFYSCECGHNDIQDSSYDAESPNKYQLMAEEVGGLYQVLNNRGFKIEFDNGYELSVMIGAGTYSDNYDISPIGEMARGLESSTAEIAVIHNGLMLPLDEYGGSTVIGYVPTSVLPSLFEAVSKGDDEEIRNVVGQFKAGDFDAETFEAPDREIKKRKLCDTCHKQRLTPSASYDGITTCATCKRRGISKRAESFEAPSAFDNKDIISYLENSHRSIRRYNAPHRYTSRGIANHFGVARSNISKRMKILKDEGVVSQVKRRVEDSPDEYGRTAPVSVFYLTENKLMEAEESDGFIGRIPKSRGLREKTKILKNNVRIIFEEAQRPLYPMEVMTLYEQKKYGDKPQRKSKYKSSPRAKKLGITQKKLSQIINSQKDRYYVSRRGLIHYIGEGSMQDYIKNLDPKYFAEEDSKSYNSLPDEDDILKFLKESHRFIRKYNAPYKYSSKGMAQKFGVSQSAMRGMMGRMERAGKVKSTPRRCEDAPKQHRRNPLKIYYLPDKKLMGA